MIRPTLALLSALLAALLAPLPSLALSCLAPDGVRLYQQAAASPRPYLVVLGQFHQAELDAVTLSNGPGYDETAAAPQIVHNLRFTGQALTRRGFTFDFDRQVSLKLTCLGPWCTGLPSDAQTLAFFDVTDGGHLLELTACGGMAIQYPDKATLQAVARCHRGGACTSAFDP